MTTAHPTTTTTTAGLPRSDAPPWQAGASSPEASPPAARLEGLSRILRGVGAAALVAAASSFLLQHWDHGGDVWRYYALLAHTGLLGVLGFVWGLRVNDGKGARTFLALAAGLVPAHFCILGGLVYSQLSWDGPLTPVARYATWIAPDPASALLAVGLTLATLSVVTGIAFVALARSRARSLGVLYLVANAALLIPTRDPSLVAVLGALGIAGAVGFELRVARRDAALRTLEGVFVRCMLFVPVGILLVRSALHYDLSFAYGAVVSAAVALGATALATERRLPQPIRVFLRGGALAAIGGASLFTTLALASRLPESALLPAGGVLFAAVATALSLPAGQAAWGVTYRRAAAWVLLAAMALDLWAFPGVVAAVACLITSVVALSYGFLTRRRAIFLAGGAGALLSLATHLRAAIDLYAFSHWGSLALVGIAVILAATLVERRGAALAVGFATWRERLSDWE